MWDGTWYWAWTARRTALPPPPAEYAYVGAHIEDYGAGLDAKSEDKSYVYEGDSTMKTSTQRTFQITGQRYISDDFQDFISSFAIKFWQGQRGTAGLLLFPQRHQGGRMRHHDHSGEQRWQWCSLLPCRH